MLVHCTPIRVISTIYTEQVFHPSKPCLKITKERSLTERIRTCRVFISFFSQQLRFHEQLPTISEGRRWKQMDLKLLPRASIPLYNGNVNNSSSTSSLRTLLTSVKISAWKTTHLMASIHLSSSRSGIHLINTS